jgi:hypothetical protein
MKGNTMAKMFDIEPVVLSLKLTVTKATENGLLGGVTDVEVASANGEADARFYGFASNYGSLVLNFKADGRPAKPAKADKPAPKPLTATQKAKVAALEAKIERIEDPEEARAKAYAARHRKAKAAAEPAAPAAPDMAAIVAAVMAAMQK